MPAFREAVPYVVAYIELEEGPRMHSNDGRVVSNFVVQALKGEPVTVYGDGSQTRSFCYVSDLVDGLIALMEAPDSLTGPVNLGNPVENTILEIAELILAKTGSRSEIASKPLPADDPKQRQPEISLAKSELGWQPTVPLDAGLDKTIAYFEKTLG